MTTKYKLFKLSDPGWELELESLQEVECILHSCLCHECKEETMNIEGQKAVDTMLSTPCGLEFDLEEV